MWMRSPPCWFLGQKLPTVSRSDCTILHPRQPCRRVPICPHPRQHWPRRGRLSLVMHTALPLCRGLRVAACPPPDPHTMQVLSASGNGGIRVRRDEHVTVYPLKVVRVLRGGIPRR